MNITVYSMPGCVQCNATYRAFGKTETSYEKVDVSQDVEAHELVTSLGYAQAPIVVVTDESGEIVDSWSGFQPDNIEKYAVAV